ncbi:MAG: cupredoxin domain-containing protein [Candidatus Tectomicrobia bacterium]|nr:cupredoxin domain-containing protein [Candidatus Tectomicrobia bacterium]
MQKTIIVTVIAIAILALGFLYTRAEEAAKVDIRDFSFGPRTIKVTVGKPLRWINHDEAPHAVVTEDKSIDSKIIGPGKNFTFFFKQTGRFVYRCGIHPTMLGEVVVQEQ